MDTKLDINALCYSRRIKVISIVTLGVFLPLLLSLLIYAIFTLINMIVPDSVRDVNFTSSAMFLISAILFHLMDPKAEMKTFLAATLLYKTGMRPTVKEKTHFLEKRKKEIEVEMEFLNKDEKNIIEKRKKLLEELVSL